MERLTYFVSLSIRQYKPAVIKNPAQCPSANIYSIDNCSICMKRTVYHNEFILQLFYLYCYIRSYFYTSNSLSNSGST